MFKAFELRIKNGEFDNITNQDKKLQIRLWHSIGFQKKIEFNTEYSELLKNYLKDGTIDGTELAKEVFAQNSYDVFLSYSHDDEDLVFIIAGLLSDQFGLNVFVDTFYWGSADGLLKEIDDINCKNADGTYDYAKRNLSTSHVHAMLTSAIIQIMDSSEAVIFVNTDNSVPILKDTLSGTKEYTFSPWIYEEILLTNYLMERNWSEYRKIQLNEKFEYSKKELNITYELPTENLIPLNWTNILEWMQINHELNIVDKKRISTIEELTLHFTYELKHPLNILHKMIEKNA